MPRKPFLFQKLQRIRIRVACGKGMLPLPDGWEGEEGFISDRELAQKHNWYYIMHENRMAVCVFREDELDFRFIRGEQRLKRREEYAERRRSKRVA